MGTMESAERVVIAGAGITGLAAALGLARQGIRSLVIDSRTRPGGLAITRFQDVDIAKAGVHLIHPSSDDLIPTAMEMKRLMGPEVLSVIPRSEIHFLGKTLAYPFQTMELAEALGPVRGMKLVSSMARARISPLENQPDSFETVIRNTYGDYFYKLFFRDYTHKLLGVHPREISGEWARRRVPPPSVRAALRTLFPWLPLTKIEHPHTPFKNEQFTGRDGLTCLFDGILAECGDLVEVMTEHTLTRVVFTGDKLSEVQVADRKGEVRSLACSHLISTIPLPDFIGMLDRPQPNWVKAARDKLFHRGLAFAFLPVSRPFLLQASWTYFQDPGLIFNRISEFSNIVPQAYGADRTMVCAEIAGDPGDRLWDGPDQDLLAETLMGLMRVCPELRREEVGPGFVVREPHAYPSWRQGFQAAARSLLDFVETLDNVYSIGRQGRFDYLNMDQCFREAVDFATDLAVEMREEG